MNSSGWTESRRWRQSAARLKALKNKVVNVTSDAMSAPSREWYGAKGRKADKDRKIVKTARGYDNAPNFDEKGNITEAFKVRSLADGIKKKYSNQ